MAHARNVASLPVANVQELAAACNASEKQQVPERYIRPEASAEEVIGSSHSAMLPVIDLQKLLHPQSSEEECAKLGSACRRLGFFQLINHGIPDEVMDDLWNDTTEFFNQTIEVKKKYSQLPNKLEGYGQNFVVADDQKLDWGDMLYLVARPYTSRDMRFWPTNPPTFRNSIHRYSSETAKLARCLLEFMAKDMGVEPKVLLEMF